jgi:hypothetical protein
MSIRILYCISEELIWECMDKVHCECTLENMTSHERAETVVKRELRGNLQRELPHRIEDSSGIVELYTNLSFTKPTDRLVTISGIARSSIN